jgi:hypothetical protein
MTAMEAVIKAFGFDYSSDGFAEWDWIKLTKDGRPRMVLGKTTRKGKETLLLAKRGKGLKRVDKGVRQVIFAPPGRHSEKPQQIHEGLERLYGDVRRLELFGNAAPFLALLARSRSDRHAIELSKCWLVVIASADPFPRRRILGVAGDQLPASLSLPKTSAETTI